MITKAIVEEVLTPYQVRVRIPILDRVSSSELSTPTEELNIATICSLPNCYINVQKGDIVFVGFEDNTYRKAVILGHLSREACITYSDINLNSLVVNSEAKLPVTTHIGDVQPHQLAMLKGLTDNIQKQLDSLKEQQDRLLQAVFNT